MVPGGETTAFNSRLQPTRIGLGNGVNSQNLLKLDYEYGATASANNGNVTKQTINVPTVGQTPGFTAVQDYTYDSLNRLKSAVENITHHGGSQSMSWQQTFEFDRYGNRNFDEANTTFAGFDKLCGSGNALCEELRKVLNPDVNQSDNRLSSSDGYVFDDSGNTTRDPQLRKFTYDAENKQVKVESVDSGGTVTGMIGEYVYDGDGKRIKKIVPSAVAPFDDEITVFVYDAAGKLVAEYATEISQDPKVSYTTADHLGSPRMLTDENGATISRRDFHPFGEEILTTHRHPDHGYTPDDLRQKFTTYERDGETHLDFAQARYHNFGLGRFSSPDPAMASAIRSNPQSWHRYSYVLNNPYRYVDPSGLKWGVRTIGNTDYYCYAKGKVVCQGYTEYKGSGILENASINGKYRGAIRLLPGGKWEDVVAVNVPGAGRSWLTPQDADAINQITGGAICSLSSGAWCPNAGQPLADNVAKAGDAAQAIFLIKTLVKSGVSLAVIAAIVKKNPEDVMALARSLAYKGFRKGQLSDHFAKHGAEFGNITQNEYLKLAKKFAGSSGDEIMEEVVGNVYVKYNRSTRETLIANISDREIRTFYRADTRDPDPFTAALNLAQKLTGN